MYREQKSVARDFYGEKERRWHQIHWSHEPTRQRDTRQAEIEVNKAKARILRQELLSLRESPIDRQSETRQRSEEASIWLCPCLSLASGASLVENPKLLEECRKTDHRRPAHVPNSIFRTQGFLLHQLVVPPLFREPRGCLSSRNGSAGGRKWARKMSLKLRSTWK